MLCTCSKGLILLLAPKLRVSIFLLTRDLLSVKVRAQANPTLVVVRVQLGRAQCPRCNSGDERWLKHEGQCIRNFWWLWFLWNCPLFSKAYNHQPSTIWVQKSSNQCDQWTCTMTCNTGYQWKDSLTILWLRSTSYVAVSTPWGVMQLWRLAPPGTKVSAFPCNRKNPHVTHFNHLSLYPETHGFIHSLDGTMAFHPLHGAWWKLQLPHTCHKWGPYTRSCNCDGNRGAEMCVQPPTNAEERLQSPPLPLLVSQMELSTLHISGVLWRHVQLSIWRGAMTICTKLSNQLA